MVLFGCESWTIAKTGEVKPSKLKNKTRKVYGSNCVNGIWRIKYNDELIILHKEPSIVKTIKIARLKWLGHISRVEDNVPYMKITFPQPEGSRKQERPRLRWLDSVLTDLKNFEVKARCKKVRDRDLWSEIMREAKAHYGPHSAIEEEEK
jgi:hypothetical protein